MTHIGIVLEDPTLKSLLVYYWQQLPTHEYAVVFVGLFVLQGLSEMFSQVVRPRHVFRQSFYPVLDGVLILAFSLSGCITAYTLLLNDSSPTRSYWAGLGVLACVCIGRDLIHSILKPQYSSYLEMVLDERLVVSGIFALIRYPLPALYLLQMAAFPLIAWNSASAAMLIPACLGVLWKVWREERRLTLQLDERFEAYCRTTRRIIPFLY